MQNTTELILKVIKYDYPEEIPFYINFLPAIMLSHGDEIRDIMRKYPAFFDESRINHDYKSNMAPSYRVGETVDEWGCVWSNNHEGMAGYVTKYPIPNREDIPGYEVPKEDAGLPHGFMYLRLLDLRGFEEVMLDFAEECEELQILIDKVCSYNVRQMELLCKNEPTALVSVGDDLGMQRGIAVGVDKWRKYMKPAFKRIYDVCKAHDKFVYMHTDGDIIEIMPDLVEVGVDIINPQYRANGIDRLIETCKGKIPIMLDLDRQLFPFVSPAEVRNHIRETVEKLYLPQGGLGINIEIGFDVPIENIAAIIDEADVIREKYSRR
ncbi:MAG: hypothetical protein LBD23_11465 [Oscillospiraceae bacterium]|nr:hypothetical protein [Oscillospiraceae bacterium]